MSGLAAIDRGITFMPLSFLKASHPAFKQVMRSGFDEWISDMRW
jgi:hypothetical protein